MRLNNTLIVYYLYFFAVLAWATSCSNSNDNDDLLSALEPPVGNSGGNSEEEPEDENDGDEDVVVTSSNPSTYKLLALGDSYTIGQSVCEDCRFPNQLKDSLNARFPAEDGFFLDIIAQTGWTTRNLISAIERENPPDNYDFVTLLIGVNNQYQRRPFEIYEEEFIELLNTAIRLAGGERSNVVVVSIPDYAFTPFGQAFANPNIISEEIDAYNDYAKKMAESRSIDFVNITDITREGLAYPNLVASDNLHPSTIAYTRFVDRILPLAIDKLED